MTNRLTTEQLRQCLDYDPESGLFRWRIKEQFNGVEPGRIAGHLKKSSGYVIIKIACRGYFAHQLAWLHYYGEWADSLLDHRNMTRSDNRISNLRKASNTNNQHNRRRLPSNKSGFKGVYWHKDSRKWCACITANRKRHFLGYFDRPDQAHNAYVQAATRLHGEFARAA